VQIFLTLGKTANEMLYFYRHTQHQGWQLMLGAHSLLPLWLTEWTTAMRCCMARLVQSHASYRWYWMPPLVLLLTSANTNTLHRCFATLFTGCQSRPGYSSRLLLWPSTVSEVLVPSTSSKSSAQSRTCHVDHFVRLATVTCSLCGLTRPLASEVSLSRLLSSGTRFHLTYVHRTSVANSSDLSWKPIFLDKSTLHDSSENVVEECNL